MQIIVFFHKIFGEGHRFVFYQGFNFLDTLEVARPTLSKIALAILHSAAFDKRKKEENERKFFVPTGEFGVCGTFQSLFELWKFFPY